MQEEDANVSTPRNQDQSDCNAVVELVDSSSHMMLVNECTFKAPRRAKDEVLEEISTFVKANSLLRSADFDGPVKQRLHGVHGKGGRMAVREVLNGIKPFLVKDSRQQVKNWPAYIITLLRKFCGDSDPKAAVAEVPGAPPDGVADMVQHPNGGVTPGALVGTVQQASLVTSAAQTFLEDLLTNMDGELQQLSQARQRVIQEVEKACREGLGSHFKSVEMVGSTAIGVETPGSDVDMVCFTQSATQDGEDKEAPEPCDVLQRVVERLSQEMEGLSLNLIGDARVPILRIVWDDGSSGQVTADLSVDQPGPLEHVRWFRRVGAASIPSSSVPAQDSTLLVMRTLRCVKWWLKMRRIPRKREGGLPTLVWLLMGVHAASLARAQTMSTGLLGASLLSAVYTFFHCYASLGGLRWKLLFTTQPPFTSELQAEARPLPAMWDMVSLADPTSKGQNLAPELSPATQVLFMYELRRACQFFSMLPHGCLPLGAAGLVPPDLESVFQPLERDLNILPATCSVNIGILVLPVTSRGEIDDVRVAILRKVVPRRLWEAPFLHRSDQASELHVHVLETDIVSGRCWLRKDGGEEVLNPSHFICQVPLEGDSLDLGDDGRKRQWCLEGMGLDQFRSMKSCVADMQWAKLLYGQWPPRNAVPGCP